MKLTDLIVGKLGEVGWTVADLARSTNIAKQNLGPMLKGERPIRAQHLLLIDHALNLGLDYSLVRIDPADSTLFSE